MERLFGNGNGKEWECKKPFPVISNSQTIVESLGHKQYGLSKSQACLSLSPKLITTVSIMLCTTEHQQVI